MKKSPSPLPLLRQPHKAKLDADTCKSSAAGRETAIATGPHEQQHPSSGRLLWHAISRSTLLPNRLSLACAAADNSNENQRECCLLKQIRKQLPKITPAQQLHCHPQQPRPDTDTPLQITPGHLLGGGLSHNTAGRLSGGSEKTQQRAEAQSALSRIPRTQVRFVQFHRCRPPSGPSG